MKTNKTCVAQPKKKKKKKDDLVIQLKNMEK